MHSLPGARAHDTSWAMNAPTMPFRSYLQRHGAALISGAYAVLFIAFFQDTASESGDLAAAAMAFGTAPSPGYALIHALSPLFLLLPFGSPGSGLLLLNGLFMGLAIHQFSRLCAFLLEDPLAALIPPAGLMAGILFFRSTFFFSPVPLTFLCIVVLLRLLQWPLLDARRLWAAAFVMGLGFVGVHPVFRLLLAPFLLYVLWMFPAHRRAAAAAPLFGLAGAAVAIFLPLSAHRFHPALSNPAHWGGFLDTLFLRPELALAGPRSGSVYAFVWWPEALSQLERLGDSFPVELLPLVAAGLWPQKNHTPFLVFLGLGLAEWVWAVWMMPGQEQPTGWLLSAALWVAFARGVQVAAARLGAFAATAFTSFFLILAPISAWFSDGGERFHLKAPPPAAAWETLASFPESGGVWVLDPASWSFVQGAIAVLPQGKVSLSTSSAGKIPPNAWVTPWPGLSLPADRAVLPAAPLAGPLVDRASLPPALPDDADRIARSLLAAAREQPSFSRVFAARQLTAWGFVFLQDGRPRAASRMALFSRVVLPEYPWNLLLMARIEGFWDRPENARLLLLRAQAAAGAEPALYRELAETSRRLAHLERTPPAARRALLQEAQEAVMRARILAPDDPQIAQLKAEIEADTRPRPPVPGTVAH